MDRSDIVKGVYLVSSPAAPADVKSSEQMVNELLANVKIVEAWVLEKEKAARDREWFDWVWLGYH
jgi:hypothetical protein